ncbi:MAG: M56 family metallopeptidase [Limisphaerales bacterium]
MEQLAESAGWLFGWLLRNSAHAAILAAVVWLLERSVLRKLSPRWRYGLWLLVFVRLLLPIAPASSFSLYNLVELAPKTVAAVTLELLGLPAPVPVPLSHGTHPLADTPSWFLVALALWIPGAVALGILLYRDHRRLRNALKYTLPVTDSYILDLLQQSKAIMRVRGTVLLVEGEQVTSPALCGFRRPRLLVPTGLLERLSTDEIRYLFLHELAHLKRGDIALNWVLAGIQILHWFNPVVWLALRRLVSVREEVCDEFVLRSCFAGAAREYGLTLLHLLEECAPRRLMPALVGILDDVRTLRRRMRCIRTFGQSESHPWMPAGALLAVAIAGLTENKNHHALLLSASAAASVELINAARPHGHLRNHPAVRLRATHRPGIDGATAAVLESEDSRPGSTLRSFSTAFRQVVDRAFDTSGGRGRAVNLSGNLPGTTASQVIQPSSSAQGTFAPRASTAVPARALPSTSAAAPRIISRPYPLPPVGQRGDILRPPGYSKPPSDTLPRSSPRRS